MNHLFYWLVALVVVGGCSAPASVSEVNADVAAVIVTTPTEIIQPTFAPIHSMPHTVSPTVIPTRNVNDPIVGTWKLVGDDKYQCQIAFGNDGTGNGGCNVLMIPIASEEFTWQPVNSDYSFMRNYTITIKKNNANYTVMYSPRNDAITSDIVPNSMYLQRVD
jgi:hypothetical protein